jgi:hypothetical protein
MAPRCSRLTGLAAILLFAASTPLLAQNNDEQSVHHPEAQAAEGTPPAAEAPPPAGMMGRGMMAPGEGQREPMPEGMMPRGMMSPEMMQGMMESMMRGTAEGVARGLVGAMAAVHGMEPEIGPSEGMGPQGMRQHGMMHSRGVGPALLYGPPAEGITVERARAMIEGALTWHGNPRLKLGTVEEQDEDTIIAEILTVDESLVQRLAMDRTTGEIRRVE